MRILLFIIANLFCSISLFAQFVGVDIVKVPESKADFKYESVEIPDVMGFKTLKCDFHVHTIFSDGEVKPEYRVWEAKRRGLDVIAITDHIEWRPNDFITADMNESNERAQKTGQEAGIIVVPGAEITRSKPLGHLNALFVQDVNSLNVSDPLVAIDNALKQKSFIMWNHPGWPNDSSTIYNVHKELISRNKIHGIELVNFREYYPKAFNYCKTYDLAYMSNSDIHGIYELTYKQEYNPMTIIFAKEKTLEGVKDALFAKRTIAKFGDLLIGSEQYLRALLLACLDCGIEKEDKSNLLIKITNNSGLNFMIRVGNKIMNANQKNTIKLLLNKNEDIYVMNMHITDSEVLKINYQNLLK